MDKKVLLAVLETRFITNMHRHENVSWQEVKERLLSSPEKLLTINKMESLGGEPDLVRFNDKQYYYVDYSKESPTKRRSLCYDNKALHERKTNKPLGDAISLANDIGIELLTKEEYKHIQQLEPIDLKTSSWLKTNDDIRALGGAIFGENRYNKVFFFHNGAQSYYSSRGFRGKVKI